MSEVYEPVRQISVWVDGGIHIKTRDPVGDPVEMSEEEALAWRTCFGDWSKENGRHSDFHSPHLNHAR